MGQDTSQGGPGVTEPRSPEEIRADIEATRHEMGATVEALAHKADVKGQAKEKVAGVRQNVTDRKARFTSRASDAAPASAGQAATQARTVAKANPLPLAAFGAFVAGLVIGRLSSR